MSSRPVVDARDLNTNEYIFFNGAASATAFSDGNNLEDKLGSIKPDISALNIFMRPANEEIIDPKVSFLTWDTLNANINIDELNQIS